MLQPVASTTEPSGDRRHDTPVVLVHGFGHNRSGWFVLDRRLRQAGFTCVQMVNYNPLRNDIAELCDQLADRIELIRTISEAPRVHVIGHSLGGMAILSLAATTPEEFGARVRAVVLANTAAADLLRSALGSLGSKAALRALPAAEGPTAVTVGFFDGVHRGHHAILARTVQVGRARGLRPVAITFDRHPRETLSPGKEPPLLTTLDRKVTLIAEAGIEELVALEFDQAFAEWPPEAFVRRILVEGLHTAHAVIGANFTFGHKAAGNLALLSEMGPGHGFSVEGVSLLQEMISTSPGPSRSAWPRLRMESYSGRACSRCHHFG